MQTTDIPDPVKYESNVQLKRARFTSCKISSGLALGNENFSVTQTISTTTHKSAYAQEGINSGCHYYAFKIINGGPNNYVMIGLGSSVPLNSSSFPGASNDPGVSYYGGNGHSYYSNTYSSFGETYTTNDEIGMLVNMDLRTVTFFKNGQLVGTAAGSDVIKPNTIYYPIVSLYQLGQKVISLEVIDESNNLTKGCVRQAQTKHYL